MMPLIKKIMEYPKPPPVVVDPAHVLANELISGLSEASPTMTTAALYARLSKIAYLRDDQQRFKNYYESLMAPGNQDFARKIVAEMTLGRFFANYIHLRAVVRSTSVSAPPVTRVAPAVGVSGPIAASAVDYVVDSARAIATLRAAPVSGMSRSSIMGAPPIPTARELFGREGGVLCRSDSGSSITACIIDILTRRVASLCPDDTHLHIEQRLANTGNTAIAALRAYYERTAYPHDTVVEPLAELQRSCAPYATRCAEWLSRLESESGGAWGVIDTRSQLSDACKGLRSVCSSGDGLVTSACARYSPDELSALSSTLDEFAAYAYCACLVQSGRDSLPDPDAHEDPALRDAERDAHEQCCAAMHQTLDQALRTVYDECDSDTPGSPIHGLRRVYRVGVRAYDDITRAMQRFSREVAQAVRQVQNPEHFTVLRVSKNIGTVPTTPEQHTAWRALCKGSERMPAAFFDTVCRLRDVCLERLVNPLY